MRKEGDWFWLAYISIRKVLKPGLHGLGASSLSVGGGTSQSV